MTNTMIQSKKWYVLAAGAILAMVAVASPSLRADAAAPQAVPTPDGQHLTMIYNRLVLASADQANRLEYSGEVAGEAQQWINTLKAEGKDVSALETALSAFNAGIATANGFHNTGAGILSTHAGFDGSGNVTDAQQALNTVTTAANNLRQAHLAITQAAIDFRNAVHDWRGKNGS